MHRVLIQNPGNLPQELIDLVLDFLADDFPSLLACATVCRTWTSTAQSLIFSRVNLRRDDGKKRQAISDHTLHSISAFSNLFSSHVHLASFVHTIQLRSRGPALFRNARKGNSWWRPLNESLGPLIPQFTRLKCLELSYERIYGWDAFVAWEGVRTLTLGSPHLRELDLCTVTFENIASLLRLLSDVDALEVLSMQGIAFIETEHPLDPKDALPHAYTTDKRLRLKSLSIHGMPRHIYEVLISAFLHPQSPADIRFLHCLELHWDHNMVIAHNSNSAVPFLSSNQKTLEHFSTCESFEAEHLRPLFQSGSLRSLQLTALPTASVWLDRMKEALTGISLQSLHSLTVDPSGQYSKFCLYLDTARWNALDETLVQSGLGNLTILILRSPSQYQQYWDLDWAEPDDFQCVLPKLQSRGALSVELDVLDM